MSWKRTADDRNAEGGGWLDSKMLYGDDPVKGFAIWRTVHKDGSRLAFVLVRK